MPKKRNNFGIDKTRVNVSSPRRVCANCGKLFQVPLIKRGNRKNSLEFSKRKTCSARCRNDMVGTATELAHERWKDDPEAYAQWVGRDYAEMGRKGRASQLGG